jgi:hypothetical protein
MSDPYSALKDDYDKTWEMVWERDEQIANLQDQIAELKKVLETWRKLAKESYYTSVLRYHCPGAAKELIAIGELIGS